MKQTTFLFFLCLSCIHGLFSVPPGGTSRALLAYQHTLFRNVTPSASPKNTGEVDFFLTASFIYWRAEQSGQSFGVINNVPNGTATSDQRISSGYNTFVNNKYSPGFKVGMGLDLASDGWDVYLEYTWFKTNTQSATFSGNSSIYPRLFNLLGFQETNNFIIPNQTHNTAKGFWHLSYNQFDLELGRAFFISQKLTLRPHIGLKGGWQKQRLNTRWYIKPLNETPDTWQIADYKLNNTTHFWDIGPKVGLDTSWFFIQDFSLFGNFSLSSLWSDFTYKRKDFVSTDDTSDPSSNFENAQLLNIKNGTKQLTEVIELSLGLRYEKYFNKNDYRIRLDASFDTEIWFNTNKLNTITPALSTVGFRDGNLTLQGLTVTMRFDF